MTTVVDMPLDTILARVRERTDALRTAGVDKLFVFGSRARGDARPDSDLDVLIDLVPDARLSLLDLIGVGHIIEDATGLKVQATLRRSIPATFAARIADNLVEVF